QHPLPFAPAVGADSPLDEPDRPINHARPEEQARAAEPRDGGGREADAREPDVAQYAEARVERFEPCETQRTAQAIRVKVEDDEAAHRLPELVKRVRHLERHDEQRDSERENRIAEALEPRHIMAAIRKRSGTMHGLAYAR